MKKIIGISLFYLLIAPHSFSQTNYEENIEKYGNTTAERYSRKAYELYSQNKTEPAMQLVNKAIASDSTHAYSFYVRSLIYLDKKNDLTAALNDLNKAIALKKSSPDAAYYLIRAEVKRKLKDYKGAIEDYEMVMKIKEGEGDTEYNQNYAKAFSGRGITKYEMGDKKGACEDLKKGKKLGDYDGEQNIKQYCK